MDDLDIKIISMLQDNGRASNAGIARDVGIVKVPCDADSGGWPKTSF